MAVRKKYIRRLLAVLLVMLLAATTIALAVSAVYKSRLKLYIHQLVSRSSNGLYNLQFGALYFNVFTGDILLQDVHLRPDMVRYRQLAAEKLAQNNVVDIKLPRLLIGNIHSLRLLRHNRLHVSRLVFSKPKVNFMHYRQEYNDNRPPRPAVEPYKLIAGLLKEVRIDDIRFKNADFSYNDYSRPRSHVTRLQNINIRLSDLLLDEHSFNDSSRIYLLKDVAVSADKLIYTLPDSSYTIKLGHAAYNYSSRKLSAEQLELLPGARARTANMYGVKLAFINAYGVDITRFTRTQMVAADSVNINYGLIDIFTNQRLKKPRPAVQHWPQAYFNRISVPFSLKKVLLARLDVKYRSLSAITGMVGEVQFNNTRALVQNLSNVDSLCRQTKQMRGYFRTQLYGQAPLAINIACNTATRTDRFNITARLDSFKLRNVNSMARPGGRLGLKRGTIHMMVIKLQGDSSAIRGRMYSRYNGLAVTIFKQDSVTQEMKRRGLLSTFTNSVLLRQDNPDAGGHSVVGIINHKYKPGSPFLGYVWHSVLEGLRYTVGFTKADEEAIRAKVETIKQFGRRE